MVIFSSQSHIWSFMIQTFHIGYLLCVEFCQVLSTLVERFIMLPRSRSRTRLIYMLLLHWKYTKTCFSFTSKCSAPALGEDKNMFARLYQNKCYKFLIIFLSKVCCKKRHRLCKNIKRWTQKRSKVKKRRKRKRNENKDNPYSRKKCSTKEKYISESIVELC